MAIEGKKLYLGNEPITLIQNNGFVEVDPTFVAPAPTWTPADFTDVQYWWTADEGVTESGTGVSQWRDQINNYDLIQGTDSSRPSLTTSSNMNNQNVISFNGTSDFLRTSTAPASYQGNDWTALFTFYIPNTTPGDGVIFGFTYVGNGGSRFWLDGLSGNMRLFDGWTVSSGGTSNNIQSPITTGKHAFKFRYDTSAGDTFRALDTLTETSNVSNSNTNFDYYSNGVFAMGALIVSRTNPTVFSSRYINYEIGDAVVIHGTPSSDEMDDWKTYVNNKYGTIIS